MLDTKITIKSSGNFSPLPMGVYTVQVSDVNIKRHFNKFKAIEEDMLNYSFTVLNDIKLEDGSSTRGRMLWKMVTPSMNSKSWLFKIAIAAYGKELTTAEMSNFNPESLVGKQVDIMVNQTPNSDGTAIYNNILTFAKNGTPLTAVEVKAVGGTVEKSSTPVSGALGNNPFLAELEADGADSTDKKAKK
jgi:hypothetical protein